MICPNCGSSEIRVSRSIRWSDVFRQMWGSEAFRCRDCQMRFYAPLPSASSSESRLLFSSSGRPNRLFKIHKRRSVIRRLVVIAIFTVAFALFLCFLYYLSRAPAQS